MADTELSGSDWIIPAARYKTKLDHVIPLSQAARNLLASIPRIKGVPYIFTHGAAPPLVASRNSRLPLIRRRALLAGRCMICAVPAAH